MKFVRILRVVLGFLVAALWLPAAMYVGTPRVAGDYTYTPWAAPMLLTVPLTVLFAVPAFVLLRRRLTLLVCLAAGAAIGAIGAVLFLLATNWQAGLNWAPGLVGYGVFSSALFWVGAVWRNEGTRHAV